MNNWLECRIFTDVYNTHKKHAGTQECARGNERGVP